MQDENYDKAAKIGKISASGSIYLFVGRILSTVISAVGTIILGLLILQSDYGLYTIALIPLTTILLFQDWGITYAISRQCARCRANRSEGELRKIIIAGLTFEIVAALLLTIIAVTTANFLAVTVFNQPASTFLMIIVSASILSTAVFGVSQSIFVGFENMKIISSIAIVQAIVQCVSAPVLILLGYGALGAIIGYVLTSIVGGIFSMLAMYFSIYRKIPYAKVTLSDLKKTLKTMLHYGIPLALGTILAGLLSQINIFVMALYVKDLALIGNYKIATNFTVLITFFTFPIMTVLFPAFSKIDPKKELQLAKTLFASSVKYAALLLVPATMILIILATPIIGTLYGGKWEYAPVFLSYTVIIYLFSCLGSITISAFFSALGETKLLLKTNIIYLLTGIPLAFILIPWLGITGMIIGPLIAGFPPLGINLYFAQKKFGCKVHYASSAKILLSSLFSAVIVYLFISVIHLSYWVQLACGMLIFIGIYLSSISLFGAVNKSDVDNLRAMFCGFGALSSVFNIPLSLIERILSIRLSVQSRLKKYSL